MNGTVTTSCLVASWATKLPEGVALRTEAGAITWAEWHRRIARIEQQLAEAGIGEAARVALCIPTSVELLSLLVALFRRRAVACPVNPQLPPAYRARLLARLDCALLIDADWTGPLGDILHEMKVATPEWNLDKPATIIFTSGSTGEPKAAVLSLRNHLESARASNANIPLGSEDAWLLSLPLHHVAGFGVLFRCLRAGATIAIPASGAPLQASLDGVTHFSLVARQLAQLLDAGAPLDDLKAILLGGSAIPEPLLDRAFAADLPIHTSYGMTETATQIAATPPGASRAQLKSSGRPLRPGTIRVGDDDRIHVKGPARFLGYWNGGALSCPFDEAGWFATSDCGCFDDDGFLHVTGRKDNVFIAGGENIQPEEIERALCALPGVTQAIVVPVAHPEFGATPVAFVEGGDGREDQMRAALAGVLPRFAQPHCYLTWPPHLSSGEGIKIQRADFAALAEAWIASRRDDQ